MVSENSTRILSWISSRISFFYFSQAYFYIFYKISSRDSFRFFFQDSPRNSFWDLPRRFTGISPGVLSLVSSIFFSTTPQRAPCEILWEVSFRILSWVISGIPLGTSSRIALEIPSGITAGFFMGFGFLQEFRGSSKNLFQDSFRNSS